MTLDPFVQLQRGANTTSATMFVCVTATGTKNIRPFFDSANLYGVSDQLSSRLIPEASLSTSTSIQGVAETIWAGTFQSGPPDTFGAVPPFLLGNMPAATPMRQMRTLGYMKPRGMWSMRFAL